MSSASILAWMPFDNGATLGQEGSGSGVIIRDEEHDEGARITLEKESAHRFPRSQMT